MAGMAGGNTNPLKRSGGRGRETRSPWKRLMPTLRHGSAADRAGQSARREERWVAELLGMLKLEAWFDDKAEQTCQP